MWVMQRQQVQVLMKTEAGPVALVALWIAH
jgi:hypothetical protein